MADFDDSNNWTNGAPGFGGGDIAYVTHSNLSVEDEVYVQMEYSTQTVYGLRLSSADTGGADFLYVRFKKKGAGTVTMTVSTEIKLDATDGPVSVTLSSGEITH